MCAIAAYGGVLAGYVQRMREITGRETVTQPLRQRLGRLAVRIWPLILGVAVLLSLTTTPGPTVLTALVVGSAVIGRVVGGFSTRRWLLPLVVVGIVGPVVLIWFLSRAAPWNEWEGMMLNLFLAAAGIGLSFPLGVLLALGRRAGRRTDSPIGGIVVAVVLALPVLVVLVRRGIDVADLMTWLLVALAILLALAGFHIGRVSTLPLIRIVSIGYIEFFRGVPLYVLLLLGGIALGFFLPRGMETPGLVVRAIVVFTLFTAAYIAEIVRGGLAVAAAWADRGGPGPRAQAGQDDGADRPAAGVAQRHPGDRRAVHQPVQGHHARRRGDGAARRARASPTWRRHRRRSAASASLLRRSRS